MEIQIVRSVRGTSIVVMGGDGNSEYLIRNLGTMEDGVIKTLFAEVVKQMEVLPATYISVEAVPRVHAQSINEAVKITGVVGGEFSHEPESVPALSRLAARLFMDFGDRFTLQGNGGTRTCVHCGNVQIVSMYAGGGMLWPSPRCTDPLCVCSKQ